MSQLTSTLNPESGTVSYLYDDNGNLSRRTDARNSTRTDYVYDALNRLTNRNYTIAGTTAATPNVTYSYDGAGSNFKGRLRSVSSTNSTTNITSYDHLGRVLAGNQVTGGQTYSFSYSYNQAGGLLTETYPSGRIITTGYDTAGRLSSLTGQQSGESDKTYTSSFNYAAHGGVGSMQLGNALWEHTNFNSRLQPTQIGLGTSSSDSSKLQLDYGFGSTSNNGNMLSRSIVIGGTTYAQSYTYDALNRLGTASEGSNWSQTYDYDQYGNRAVTGAGDYIPAPALTPTSTGAYNPASNHRNSAGYVYDLAGNLTTEASTRTMTYDAENRMVSYNGGQGTVTYSYDGDGRRVAKLEAEVTTIYVYDAQGRLATDYMSDAPPGSGDTSYLMADHLGSTRVITDSGGTIKARRDYLPFGEEIASGIGGRSGITGYGTVDGIRQRFTGQYRDTESGLDYFIARHHSGPQGRFQSPDPENAGAWEDDPQSWNGYAYARNNPLLYTDPSGEGYVICQQKDAKTTACRVVDDLDKFKQENPDLIVAKGGDILAKNENGTTTKVGSWDVELNRSGTMFVTNMAQRADASNKAIGLLAATSVAWGAWVAVGLDAVASSGLVKLTTLGIAGASVLDQVSRGNLRHIAQHLQEFKRLDPSMTLEKVVQIGLDISSRAENLVGTPGGRKVFQQTVTIGGQQVPVKVVLNPAGGLRNVLIKQY